MICSSVIPLASILSVAMSELKRKWSKQLLSTIFNPEKINFVPHLSVHKLCKCENGLDFSALKELPEGSKGLLIDYHEHAIIKAIHGILHISSRKIWFKIQELPTGWGDFILLERKNNELKIISIYERKTIKDLKSTICKDVRRSQFELFPDIAEKENCKAYLILGSNGKEHLFKSGPFRTNLTTKKVKFGINSYNIHCFLNSLNIQCLFSADPIETAIFLIQTVMRKKRVKLQKNFEDLKRPKELRKIG